MKNKKLIIIIIIGLSLGYDKLLACLLEKKTIKNGKVFRET